MGDFVPHPDGVWLAGGGNFDVPGGPYRMEDFDGDGVWEITVPRQRGFSSYYTFTNGPCPDYSCKENIEGQSCAQPQNFNDRWLPPVTQDTVVATCFQLCTTTTDCTVSTGEAADGAVSFRLLGNPGGELTLVFDQPAAATRHLTVFNPLGQAMQSVRLNAFETAYRLDTNGFAPGIYFINVQTGGRQGSLRVVIP
jgi:hypothetical protein